MTDFKFMEVVETSFYINEKEGSEYLPCLFIAYYRMKSLHQRALLYCPKHKQKFFQSLVNIKKV